MKGHKTSTEENKAALNALIVQVENAQYRVDESQAIATSLTQKLNSFQNFLAVADARRTPALNNKNLVAQLVQSSKDLQDCSHIALNEMLAPEEKTQGLATTMSQVMNKLIYSAGIINKLTDFVVREKALNPLISDELISLLTTARTNAGNAVAVSVAALQSTFAAQASSIACRQALTVEYTQAADLYDALTGISSITQPEKTETHLSTVLADAYKEAQTHYELAYGAVNTTTGQLDNAQIRLNKSQVTLASLQADLAAANAAALCV